MGRKQLSQSEIIDLLGISRTTLFRMVQEGLDYVEGPGGKKYFDEDEVRLFIKVRKQKLGKELVIGNEYSNDDIVRIFRVATLGGIRDSHSRNALVLFSIPRNNDFLNCDYWKDDILFYTVPVQLARGYFKSSIKKIVESNETGKTLHLFERVCKNGYQYRGIVTLAEKPFLDKGYDKNGDEVDVWRLPLKLIRENDYWDRAIIEEQEATLRDDLKDYMGSTLFWEKAKNMELPSTERIVKTKITQMNTIIKEYVFKRADGHCEFCKQKAPFEHEGRPFLLLSHIVPISCGGKDSVDNVAAVCPNCNAKLAFVGKVSDLEILKQNVEKNEKALRERIRKDMV